MNTRLYLQTAGIFALLYAAGVAVVTVLTLKFEIRIPSLRWITIFIAALGTVFHFMNVTRNAPENKDVIALIFTSLSAYWLVALALYWTAGKPLTPALFLIQSAVVTVFLWVVYGYLAKYHLYKNFQ